VKNSLGGKEPSKETMWENFPGEEEKIQTDLKVLTSSLKSKRQKETKFRKEKTSPPASSRGRSRGPQQRAKVLCDIDRKVFLTGRRTGDGKKVSDDSTFGLKGDAKGEDHERFVRKGRISKIKRTLGRQETCAWEADEKLPDKQKERMQKNRNCRKTSHGRDARRRRKRAIHFRRLLGAS